jgi:hypothetical protein
MLNWLIKILLKLKLKKDPCWLASVFPVDERTDINVLVERQLENGVQYGTRFTPYPKKEETDDEQSQAG